MVTPAPLPEFQDPWNLSGDDASDEEGAREKVRALRKRLEEGEDFGEVARQFSEDATAAAGGDLGYFTKGGGLQPEVEETAPTFVENALLKARSAADASGLAAIADDSGIEVDALHGAPGVRSARYAGEDATDKQRCISLLCEMEGIANRKAAFECVISIAVPTGAALTYEARCQGRIAESLAGENGFGYDPIFFFQPLKKSFAQLTLEEKNQVSHRGKALRDLKDEFDKVLTWIRQQIPEGEKRGCQDP